MKEWEMSHLHEPLVVESDSNREDIVEEHQAHSAERPTDDGHRTSHPHPPAFARFHRNKKTNWNKKLTFKARLQ